MARLKISTIRSDSRGYLSGLENLDVEGRKTILIELASTIERAQNLKQETSRGDPEIVLYEPQDLVDFALALNEGLTSLLEDFHRGVELASNAKRLLADNAFWERQDLQPILVDGIIQDSGAFRTIDDLEGWDTVGRYIQSWAEVYGWNASDLLRDLEQCDTAPLAEIEDRLFKETAVADFYEISGAYAYCGSLYDVSGAFGHTNEEVGLLIMEQIDKSRLKFERLRRKFTSSEIREAIAVRERIAEEVRIAVWRRDDGKCVRCGSREKLEYDHVIPVSKGGSNTVRNIELLCERCNRSKGSEIR